MVRSTMQNTLLELEPRIASRYRLECVHCGTALRPAASSYRCITTSASISAKGPN